MRALLGDKNKYQESLRIAGPRPSVKLPTAPAVCWFRARVRSAREVHGSTWWTKVGHGSSKWGHGSLPWRWLLLSSSADGRLR